jgi:hypothetical protein
MNWRSAALKGKASVSIQNEADHFERDPAARWLERYTRWMAGRRPTKEEIPPTLDKRAPEEDFRCLSPEATGYRSSAPKSARRMPTCRMPPRRRHNARREPRRAKRPRHQEPIRTPKPAQWKDRRATSDIDRRLTRNVRFGSKADICSASTHVRFTPESGHWRCS